MNSAINQYINASNNPQFLKDIVFGKIFPHKMEYQLNKTYLGVLRYPLGKLFSIFNISSKLIIDWTIILSFFS